MKALIVVDMQVDFMPGGALGCKDADKLIPIINALLPKFPLVVATKDWHPPHHCSFASSHSGIWPDHCIQNTPGAAFDPRLDQTHFAKIFYKGTDLHIDSYSAFYDNDHKNSTGLTAYLKSRGVTEIFLAGLLTEYCVLYSALDALHDGFAVTIIQSACKGIDLKPGDSARALEEIKKKGGRVIDL